MQLSRQVETLLVLLEVLSRILTLNRTEDLQEHIASNGTSIRVTFHGTCCMTSFASIEIRDIYLEQHIAPYRLSLRIMLFRFEQSLRRSHHVSTTSATSIC